jgi:branched-chain amino acid transport system permease protein
VASGFTLVFGLMRNVNLAHGSLYLFGAYVGYEVASRTGYWLLGVAAGFLLLALVGAILQVAVFRRLEGDDLRQTLVSIGISIVAADLMLAVWTGATYQIGIPDWLDGSVTLPIITAVRSSGTAVYLTYPFYRLFVLAVAVIIGIGLWLMLNRTRVGMMIRAGVDDRAMLAASGVNVHVVFAIVFAVGAGLAGFAGVVGGSALSVAPGEGRPLSACLAGGGDRRRHGLDSGRRDRRVAHRARRADRPGLFPDLRHRSHLRHHGRGAGRAAARPVGSCAVSATTAFGTPQQAAAYLDSIGIGHILLAALLIAFPFVANDFFIAQIGAYSLIFGMIALSLMLLAGYGGMVSLAQITVAGVAGYVIAIFGVNQTSVHGFGWPLWILVPFAVLVAACVSALIGWISVRTAGIYTIMITLAIATAFFYFTQQNYSLFNGHSGFSGLPSPRFWGIDWRAPAPFYALCLASAAGLLYRGALHLALHLRPCPAGHPRQSAPHARARFPCHRPQGRGLLPGRADRRPGRRPAGLVQRPHLAGTVGVDVAIDVLVIAVVGGIRHPIGPFFGAVVFVLLKTFAIDLVGAERFNTLIGAVFLAIVLVSPDGLLGLWQQIKPHLSQQALRPG